FGTGHKPYLRTPAPVPPGATQPGFSTGGHPGFNLQPGPHPGFNRQPGGHPGFSTTFPDLGDPRLHDHPVQRHKRPGGFHRHPGFDDSSHFDRRPGFTSSPGVHGGPGFHRHPGLQRPGHFNRFGWHGGFWHGSFWPHVHYHANVVHFWPVLPAVYSVFWHDGVSYFYVDRAYYTWNPDRNGYVITDPPPAIESGTSTVEPEVTPSGGATYATEDDAARIYVYPRNGQSEEQTANDRYECHQWAVEQTGFDPTSSETSGAGSEVNDPTQSDMAGNAEPSTAQRYATASDYRRALIACLDARGYSAR
ncbi:MAG: hypothetical protein IRZ28_16860, partial [Steroidobacteraceae bacterium]|nr:hypothetical protein [Steroidobacteraceae bacterium]